MNWNRLAIIILAIYAVAFFCVLLGLLVMGCIAQPGEAIVAAVVIAVVAPLIWAAGWSMQRKD